MKNDIMRATLQQVKHNVIRMVAEPLTHEQQRRRRGLRPTAHVQGVCVGSIFCAPGQVHPPPLNKKTHQKKLGSGMQSLLKFLTPDSRVWMESRFLYLVSQILGCTRWTVRKCSGQGGLWWYSGKGFHEFRNWFWEVIAASAKPPGSCRPSLGAPLACKQIT